MQSNIMRLGSYYRGQILSHFNIQATGKNVLDVGGYDGYWLSIQSAKNKYVIDGETIRIYLNIKYINQEVPPIPFKDNYFDQVFSLDVLEHVERVKEKDFMNEIIRVCKDNGEIYLTVPSKTIRLFPPFLTNYISRKWGHNKCNGYSKDELSAFLSTYPDITYKILQNNAPYLRKLYLPIRSFWYICPNITQKIIRLISIKDYKNRRGDSGFYIIKIIKN